MIRLRVVFSASEILAILIMLCAVNARAQSGSINVAQPGSSSQVETDRSNPQSGPEARGDLFMAQKRYESAIREFEQAPQNSAIICNKTGVAYHYMLNMVAAKSHYEKALQFNPRYAEAMNNLAAILYSGKSYGAAEKLYKRGLKLSPRNAAIYSNLGTLYFAQGNYGKGMDAYRIAYSLDPNVFQRTQLGGVGDGIPAQQRAMLNYSLAKTYAQVGKNDQALQYLRLALGEGFKDRKKLLSDVEFASLRGTTEFRDMLTDHSIKY